jgi:hypothetical protein
MQFSIVLFSVLVSITVAKPTVQRRDDGTCLVREDCDTDFYCDVDTDSGESGKSNAQSIMSLSY